MSDAPLLLASTSPQRKAILEQLGIPFDVVHSEYGASIWADPYLWIPEAARLLRPGGHLIFLRNATLLMLCMAMEGVKEQLQRPQSGLRCIEWEDTGEVEFHLPHGEQLDLLHANGFELERLIELLAPKDSKTHEYYGHVSAEWAQQWPSEELWVARRRG